jgi:5'-nucleotidase
MFKILVSNDDGVFSPGIRMLAESLKPIGRISVVAPDRNRSGASNSLTLHRPLHIRTLQDGYMSVDGTPTDCVHLAITGCLEACPDMVVSGINDSANLGDDVLYSGTVAAAIEGRFLGLPAIAFSLVTRGPARHYDTAGEIAKKLVALVQKKGLPENTILNVNIPDVPASEIKGFEITRCGYRHSSGPTIRSTDPRGHTIYWIGPSGEEQACGPGTDFHAVRANKVSITPMRVDMTAHDQLPVIAHWLNNNMLD